MSEAAIAAAGTRILKQRGAWGLNTHGTEYGRRGIPDWVGTYRGQTIAIEYKTPRGQLTRLQTHELQRARQAGAHTCVARTPADIEQLLDNIDQHLDNAA